MASVMTVDRMNAIHRILDDVYVHNRDNSEAISSICTLFAELSHYGLSALLFMNLLSYLLSFTHCGCAMCLRRRISDISDCNLKKDYQTLTIFGTKITDITGHHGNLNSHLMASCVWNIRIKNYHNLVRILQL